MGQPEESPAESRLHAKVHGRVQGVSFRYYTQRCATDLGLTGFVRNRWDGSVEVVAEGRQARLDELLSFLRAGPRGAFVTEVDVEWSVAVGEFRRFEVHY